MVIVSYIHCHDFMHEPTSIDKARFDTKEKAYSVIRHFYPDLSTIDEMYLEKGKTIDLDAWNMLKMEILP